MSRIRTVKPEFWTSEQILNLSIAARLLFIGMWNFCDDSGIHPASLKTLKVEVFPSEDFAAMNTNIEELVNELLNQGLIVSYSFNGKSYWRVTGWPHQKIDRPNFKHPWPCGTIPRDKEDFLRLVNRYSTSGRFQGDEGSTANNLFS